MDDVDSETLIPLVKARPALYNKKLKEYNDRNIKQKLWLEICDTMVTGWEELSADEKTQKGVKIQKRWQSLRTSFKKEYNAQRDTKSGQAGKKRKKYEFYGQLLFLLPTLTERTTPTEILSTDKQQPKISAAASTSTDDSLPKAASPPTINNTPQTSAQSSIPKNKDKSISSKIYEERLLGILEEKRSEPIDEDKSFLISLVPSFKRMTNQQKLKAKMQFLQILSDIQEESDYNVIYPTASQNIEYSNEEFDMPSPESSKVTIKEEILDLGS